MPALPRDISDLHLAPVVLALDARIDELGRLTLGQLNVRVAMDSNRSDQSRYQREVGLLATVNHFIDCHSWTLLWDERGIRLTRGDNSVVLGIPATFSEYLSGVAASTPETLRA